MTTTPSGRPLRLFVAGQGVNALGTMVSSVALPLVALSTASTPPRSSWVPSKRSSGYRPCWSACPQERSSTATRAVPGQS